MMTGTRHFEQYPRGPAVPAAVSEPGRIGKSHAVDR